VLFDVSRSRYVTFSKQDIIFFACFLSGSKMGIRRRFILGHPSVSTAKVKNLAKTSV
jgi:hypothetical protein